MAGRGGTTPLFDYICCGYSVPDQLRRSHKEAKARRPRCPDCDAPMELVAVVRFAFPAFRPFVTKAFSDDGHSIEVTDRTQLDALCRQHKMKPMADRNTYFGTNPKSVPTWEEVCRGSKSGVSEATKKFVREGKFRTGTVEDWKKTKAEVDKTDHGRRDAGQITRTWVRK